MAACLALHLAALVLLAVDHAAGRPFGYTEPVRWTVLVAAVPELSWADVRATGGAWGGLALAAMVVGVTVARARREPGPRRGRLIFWAAQPFVFLPGWIGVPLWLAQPFELGAIDGEWLAEDTPLLLSLGAWVAVSTLLAGRELAGWAQGRGRVVFAPAAKYGTEAG